MISFTLALRFLKREWRSGELITLTVSLILAITSVLTVTLITDRLTSGITRQSAELTGGDLVIDSTRSPDPQWRPLGREYGLASTEVLLFDSVLFAGDEMLLGSIKAVTEGYPLLGQLETTQSVAAESSPTPDIPAPGTAWADPRILDQLKINVGADIILGASTLKVARLLTFEPDGSSLFQFAPRLLVNQADLDAAQVLGPGSRIRYKTLFTGLRAQEFQARIEGDLDLGHRLITPADENNRAAKALEKATQYIRLATLLTLILAAIAIALTARRYAERHRDTGAMLRCLGSSQRAIGLLFSYQLLLLTLLASAISAVVGWFCHEIVLQLLKPLLAIDLPPPSSGPWIIASTSALLLVAGFALPPLLRLSNTPPLRVLRKDLNPPPLSMWFAYGFTALTQGLLLLILFQDIAQILLIMAGAGCFIGVLGWLLYRGLARLRTLARGKQSLLARSLRNLAAHPVTSTSQILAFSLTLMLMILLTQLRGDLLKEWRLQLPEDAPNHFAFNIVPDQTEDFVATVSASAKLDPLYPVVLGRLEAINQDREAVNAAGDNQRELNFTWTDKLPKDNEVTSGQWPPGNGEISVEQEYAKRLGVGLGDTMDIDINGQAFEVRVSSLRSVEWESFSPNFYLIFSEQQLKGMPTSYLTSFHMAGNNRALLKTLNEKFPAMTVIEIDSIIARMAAIMGQISLAVELVLLFVLLGGFAVLFATLQTTLDERVREGALMRALGASRKFVKQAYLVEFGLIGLASGTFAVLGAEIVTALIYTQAFNLTFAPSPLLWLLIPSAMAVVVALAGYAGSRRVMAVSPNLLLAN